MLSDCSECGGFDTVKRTKGACRQTHFFIAMCGNDPCIEPGKPAHTLQTTDFAGNFQSCIMSDYANEASDICNF